MSQSKKAPVTETHSPRETLRRLIETLSLTRGNFTLASGRSSNYFFDLKPTMLHPDGSALLADALLARMEDLGADYVGGLVMGAVPLTVGLVMRSRASDHPLKGFWVRKEQKDHGAAKLVDGHLPDNAKVVVLEDVTTTGGSAMKAIKEVQARGGQVLALLTVIDRLEGARENLAKDGIELLSLYTTKDFEA
jgi:orotate phosphoribosyltransferase